MLLRAGVDVRGADVLGTVVVVVVPVATCVFPDPGGDSCVVPTTVSGTAVVGLAVDGAAVVLAAYVTIACMFAPALCCCGTSELTEPYAKMLRSVAPAVTPTDDSGTLNVLVEFADVDDDANSTALFDDAPARP